MLQQSFLILSPPSNFPLGALYLNSLPPFQFPLWRNVHRENRSQFGRKGKARGPAARACLRGSSQPAEDPAGWHIPTGAPSSLPARPDLTAARGPFFTFGSSRVTKYLKKWKLVRWPTPFFVFILSTLKWFIFKRFFLSINLFTALEESNSGGYRGKERACCISLNTHSFRPDFTAYLLKFGVLDIKILHMYFEN